KGRTAMLFSGIAASVLRALDTVVGGARFKKIRELITRATADTRKAVISTTLGNRGAVIGRTLLAEAGLLLPRRSLSGTCGLPRPSLYRLTKCSRRPYLTSRSPRSCKHGGQCGYWHRSSATCADKRICSASPQSMARCATLIPEPAMLVFSLTSVTRLTGPL